MAGENERIQHQSKVISRIHQHIATDFHPALKNVAVAAMALNKTQEANHKAFYDYLMSLNHLAASAKSAEPEAQEVTEELKVIIRKFKKIGDETSKIIGEFKEIAERVHNNAESEKENHRKTLKNYMKEQSQIHKEVEKRRRTNKDLQAFYSERHAEAIKQQLLRYKYFTEKHSKLLKRFVDSWKEIAKEFPDAPAATDAVDNESQKPESRHTEAVSPPQSEKPGSRIIVPNQYSVREEIPKPIDVDIVPDNRPRDLISPASQPDDTIGRFFKEYSDDEIPTFEKNKSERSSPQLPYSNLVNNTLENYPPRSSLQQIYLPPTPPPIQSKPVQPLQPLSREEPIQPLPRPRQKLSEAPAEDSLLIAVNTKYVPAFNERYSGLNHIEQPPVAPVPQHQVVTPPPAPPRKEKPAFTAADYGSILICTMPYTAKTEKQITLAAGEAAQLIRSGERGWVLLRSLSEQSRIGWFPAKFVRHGTEAEQLENQH
ncbi:hypothetical protein FO519_003282 [Halicephalobus sp. NKZ332]|nr:hypothetical protein FO519_003282 [Halicephalobus sp. NKZ332]